MTKADLVQSLASEFDVSKKQTGEMIERFLEEITQALKSGEKVQLTPLGIFNIRERKKREGRNPKTGEKLTIAARRVPAFSAAKALKDAVSGPKKKSIAVPASKTSRSATISRTATKKSSKKA